MGVKVEGQIIEVEKDGHKITVRYRSPDFPEEVIDASKRADGLPARCRYDRSIDLPLPHPDDAGIALIISAHGLPIQYEMEQRLAQADPGISKEMEFSQKHLAAGTKFAVVHPSDPAARPFSTDSVKV